MAAVRLLGQRMPPQAPSPPVPPSRLPAPSGTWQGAPLLQRLARTSSAASRALASRSSWPTPAAPQLLSDRTRMVVPSVSRLGQLLRLPSLHRRPRVRLRHCHACPARCHRARCQRAQQRRLAASRGTTAGTEAVPLLAIQPRLANAPSSERLVNKRRYGRQLVCAVKALVGCRRAHVSCSLTKAGLRPPICWFFLLNPRMCPPPQRAQRVFGRVLVAKRGVCTPPVTMLLVPTLHARGLRLHHRGTLTIPCVSILHASLPACCGGSLLRRSPAPRAGYTIDSCVCT